MKARLIDSALKLVALPKNYLNIIGFDKASIDIHKQHGFYDVVTPEYDSVTQELGTLVYDSDEKNHVTFLVNDIILPLLEDAKTSKIEELKNAVKDLYATVQNYITEKQIHGETIPVAVKDKIKSIRTKYLLIKSQINALTTVVEVIKFELPYEAIESLKEQLEAIE